MPWAQVYDPLNNTFLSTLAAALPIVLMLGGLAFLHMKAHRAALVGVVVAALVAIAVFGMPVSMVVRSALQGAAFGFFPIGWIVLNVLFLFQLTTDAGLFRVLQDSIRSVTSDTRLQLVLVAYSFGAFFEGTAGFGTPVAVTAALLIGLRFKPLAASGLALIANTAPVAFGALGTPIVVLSTVTGLDLHQLSSMVGRQLPLFALIVPFWLVWAFVGFRRMVEVWPGILVAGMGFAIPQFLVSNLHGPWLVDVIASICSMGSLTLFLRVWQPKHVWRSTTREAGTDDASESARGQERATPSRRDVAKAWLPWAILALFALAWGLPAVKSAANAISAPKLAIPGLHDLVVRMPPVVAKPSPEPAVYTFNWLSATGTGIFLATVVASLVMRVPRRAAALTYVRTIKNLRFSLLTIALMLCLGFVTRSAGLDATLGLAFARTGALYPFFGAMLGWLGVALTGSDMASNVLFGGLQRITAEQIGISPVLMAAANSSGGVMGKMVDAQSIVVASTATRWYGQEGAILRYVFFHSIALAALVGLLVTAQAYVPPFTYLVPGR